jgi:signal transduction histidine kinase
LHSQPCGWALFGGAQTARLFGRLDPLSATELISFIVRWAFVLIAAATLLDFARFRDQSRLDIALMFGSLGLAILGGEIRRALGIESAALTLVGSVALLAQPYLLLRLVGHFRAVPVRVHWLAVGSLVLCCGLLLAAPNPMPVPGTLLLIAYFVAVEGYATWSFVHIARQSSGVMHWRTLFAALGSGWLAATILLLAVPVVLPAASAVTNALVQVFALFSGASYYLGFAPPAPLRRAWQVSALHRFLQQAAGRPIAQRLDGSLAHLCPAVTHTVGGVASAVFLWNAAVEKLVLKASDQRAGWQPAPLNPTEGALAGAWLEHRAVQANRPAEMGPGLAALARELGAVAVMLVPIGQPQRQWGVLLAFRVKPSLFPGDDQDMLRLFAHQAAEVLESGELFQRQQALVSDLEAANKELEAFSYSVSHDLRAPLRAMNGFSQVLLEDHAGSMPEQAQHYVRRIQSNSQRMGRLVDDLLAFSRFGRQPLRLQPVDPGHIAQQAWDDLRPDHEGRAVQLELAALPPCLADASLLKQVFSNLLSNALKFTRQQALAQITVGAREETAGVTYFVRDNGVGFDMAYADKLFGVFQRLHRAEDFEGTGVGLAIVQRIVERHGGSIVAESEVGRGTTFYFTLKGV